MEETLACYCNGCSTTLGEFRNAWNVIGNNYYSPIYPILTYEDGFVGEGSVRSITLGHEPCNVQDLKCKECRAFLGVRCDSAPSGHALKRNQYLLRMSNITTYIAGTQKKAQILVKNTFLLETSDASSKKAKSRAPSIQPSRSKSMGASASVRRASSAMPPPAIPAPTTNNAAHSKPTMRASMSAAQSAMKSTFEVWAEKEIRDQRKEITVLTNAIGRVQSTMDEFKSFMAEIKAFHTPEKQERGKAHLQMTEQSSSDIVAMQHEMTKLQHSVPRSIDELKENFAASLATDASSITNRVDAVEHLAKQLQSQVTEVVDHLPARTTKAIIDSSVKLHAIIKKDLDAMEKNMQTGFNQVSSEINLIRSKTTVPERGVTQTAPRSELSMSTPQYNSGVNGSMAQGLPKVNFNTGGNLGIALLGHREAAGRTVSNYDIPPGNSVEALQSLRNTIPQNFDITAARNTKRKSRNSLTTAKETEANADPERSKQKSILQVEIPSFKPDQLYSRVLSSPDDTPSAEESSIHSIAAVADKRKRTVSPERDTRYDSVKRRKQVPVGDQNGSRRRSLENVASVVLESPEPERTGTESSKSRQESIELGKDASHTSSRTNRSGGISQREVSTLNSAAHRPVSAYGTSYHASSSRPFTTPVTNVSRRLAPRVGLSKVTDSLLQTVHAPKSAQRAHDAVLPSIERGFEEVTTPMPVNEAPTPEQMTHPYKCGGCEKRFSSAHSLKIHKAADRRCSTYTSLDEIPMEFVCSGCGGKFGSLSRFNNHDCETTIKQRVSITNPTPEDIERQKRELEAQKRKLTERDRLVKETMEREMGP